MWFFEVPWSAGEMLGYLGAIAGAVIALLGLLYGIRNGLRMQRDQAKESVAPYFSAVFLRQKNKRLHSSDKGNDSSGEAALAFAKVNQGFTQASMAYCEVEDREIYAFIGEEITYCLELNFEPQKRVESTFLDIKTNKGAVFTTLNPVIIPIRFRNVGHGCAHGVRVGVNRVDDEWAGVCSCSIDCGEDFYLGLYIDTDAKNVFGDYEVCIVFSDRLEYECIERFKLIVDKKGAAVEILDRFLLRQLSPNPSDTALGSCSPGRFSA